MKVCFETFGCRLNRAEALDEEAKYLSRGWERTERHDDAQLIVVRGCSVTARAQKDCERLVEHIKREYPFKRVLVTGCLPGADKGYFVKNVRTGVSDAGAAGNAANTGAGPVPVRTARAYLKVQDGCSGNCAFCIVPKFRGKSVSIPFSQVLARARAFIGAGYREIVVTGCNLCQYLSDGKRLPDLVAALAGLEGRFRIRLSSIEPGQAALETVSAMAAHENVCRYMHIAVQSGSPRILAAMRRPYSVRDVETLVSAAAKAMPDLGLGCDLMTGFPDERPSDHIATMGILKRLPFSKAHIFPFSERPGTVAAALPNPVPEELRRMRAGELARMADQKRTDFAKRFRGRNVEIVVEDAKSCAGWTSEYLWCSCGSAAVRKELKTVRVIESQGHRLVGKSV